MNLELLPSPALGRVVLQSTQPEVRRLVVNLTENECFIRGRVSSYYIKQLAQEHVRIVADGRKIVNLVVVES